MAVIGVQGLTCEYSFIKISKHQGLWLKASSLELVVLLVLI